VRVKDRRLTAVNANRQVAIVQSGCLPAYARS
jgi:hypothetical protein